MPSVPAPLMARILPRRLDNDQNGVVGNKSQSKKKKIREKHSFAFLAIHARELRGSVLAPPPWLHVFTPVTLTKRHGLGRVRAAAAAVVH